jgi:hypothetical protein
MLRLIVTLEEQPAYGEAILKVLQKAKKKASDE